MGGFDRKTFESRGQLPCGGKNYYFTITMKRCKKITPRLAPWLRLKTQNLTMADSMRSMEPACSFVTGKGFTLVELIVSVAITGILMLGISAFFSSTFQNLFKTQTQTTNTEKQYVVNEI